MIALTYTQLACILVGSAAVGGLIVWLAVAPLGEIMNDRELLELAAKAAGIELGWNKNDTPPKPFRMDNADWWDPLTDDGDALRLAVKLRILDLDDTLWQQNLALNEGRDYANVRRAIVRAAAEIWRKKS